MRVVIASRIFEPEPSAASLRLQSLAEQLVESGHEVEVKTVKPPRASRRVLSPQGYRVSRWPVKRDRQGYVRGYVSYLSFDIPLIFRLLFSRRLDVVIVEPPPTTGFVVRMACRLRRIPYIYYAADVWSDAARQTGAPRWIVRSVLALERAAWRGAATVLSVSSGVAERVAELVNHPRVVTIGNGVAVERFTGAIESEMPLASPYFVYAGTASEWHGATAFVEAFSRAAPSLGLTELVFIGGGSEREALETLADELDISARVRFLDTMSPEQLAPWLAHAVASLASVRPGCGYDFAFPTKLYSSAACGAPLLYAGLGPAVEFVRTEVDGAPIGQAVDYDPQRIAGALNTAYTSFLGQDGQERTERRRVVSAWAAETVSLSSVAARIIGEIERCQPRCLT